MRRNLTFILLVLFAAATQISAQKLGADDLVAKHLAALGAPQARAEAKTRVAQGTVLMQVIVGGQANLQGTVEVVSAGHDELVGMEFGHSNYQHERIFTKDGAVEVSLVNPGRRSFLGDFLYAKSHLVSEGLLGGTLSTAWPLLDVSSHSPKLKYEGLKKLDGRRLHCLRYETKERGGEVDIRLYFDPQTFHHVKTVYYFTIASSLGGGAPGVDAVTPSTARGEPGTQPRSDSAEVAAARMQTSHFRLEEDFSEFHTVDGLSLPAKWVIRMTADTNRSNVWEWQALLNEIKNNADVGPGSFALKQ